MTRDFLLVQNEARRHITQAQLALATTTVYQWRSIGENQHSEKRVATEWPPSRTNTELANIAGASKHRYHDGYQLVDRIEQRVNSPVNIKKATSPVLKTPLPLGFVRSQRYELRQTLTSQDGAKPRVLGLMARASHF
jgi:hypothetical protein